MNKVSTASRAAKRVALVVLCALVVRGSDAGTDGQEGIIIAARDGSSRASLRDAVNAVELGTLSECLAIWSMRSEPVISSFSYRHTFELAPPRARSRRTRVVAYETEFQGPGIPFAVYAPQWSSGGRGSRAAPMVADRDGLQVLRLALADREVYQYLEERMTRSDFPVVDLRVEREDAAEGDELQSYNFAVILADGEVFAWRAPYSSSSQTAIFQQVLP